MAVWSVKLCFYGYCNPCAKSKVLIKVCKINNLDLFILRFFAEQILMKELNEAAGAVKNTKDSAKQNMLGNLF